LFSEHENHFTYQRTSTDKNKLRTKCRPTQALFCSPDLSDGVVHDKLAVRFLVFAKLNATTAGKKVLACAPGSQAEQAET
jgi:hypothetical protein